jgi:hypothetical protein
MFGGTKAYSQHEWAFVFRLTVKELRRTEILIFKNK